MKATIYIPKEIELKTLEVIARVRYPEDAKVNGIEDYEGNLMPFLKSNIWSISIDIDSGIISDWPQGTTASVHYKVCDGFSCKVIDDEHNVICELKNEYVPRTMSPKRDNEGDYIIMNIDENGKIRNWKFYFAEFYKHNK